MKSIIKVLFLCILTCVLTYGIYKITYNQSIYVDKKIESIDLTGFNKLMIVAHPDDELLWGGSALIDDNYLVVCITCGVKRNRVIEFKRVMHETKDSYIMLGYPDKTDGKRDNWEKITKDLTSDLKHIIEYKDWDMVVTHNPLGEYGHIHHSMTSNIVTNLTLKNKLYYFGKYYNEEDIKDSALKIKEENLEKKKELVKLYSSQSYSVNKFYHMLGYEDLIKYEEFK